MSISSFISRRYFTGRKKMFGSFSTVISVLGVAVGVFALVLVMSVMGGFSRDLQQKLIGFNAHIIVEDIDKSPPTPLFQRGETALPPFLKGGRGDYNIAASAPIIEGEGIIESAGPNGATTQGVKIRGMDESDLSKLKGVDFNPSTHQPINPSTVLLGNELALQLGVNPEYDDRINLIVPFGRVGPTGELMPEKMEFVVSGLFHSGYFEHDSKTVIISRESARLLLGDNAKESLHIWLNDIRTAERIAAKIKAELPGKNVYTWSDANRKLYSALKLERIAMAILLALIVVIACISIISVIFMYVFSRRKDIALLESIGATKGQIISIFIKIGAQIGAIGTFLGLIAGISACIYLQHKKIELPASYYLESLPVDISWPFIYTVAVCGVLFAILASLYPANVAVSSNPNELLRDE